MSPLRSLKPQNKCEKPNLSWFESTVYSGAMILAVIRDAASLAPIAYLRQSASVIVNIIDIIQVRSLSTHYDVMIIDTKRISPSTLTRPASANWQRTLRYS